MSFICGSFNDQKEEDFEVLWPYPPTPLRKTRRHRFCCRKNKENSKNPYSHRGLDKFEALLADLDDKKQKIFTQKGSEYISFVRFVYSNSNDVKPIIVRLRDPRKLHDKDHHKQTNTKSSTLLDDHQNSKPPGAVSHGMIKAQEVKPLIGRCMKRIRIDLNMKRKLQERWMPSYNLPLLVILVLVFLTFFGRSLAIICTSIAWYMIPTIDATTTKREPSENKMISSPKAFYSGPINVQQKHNKMKKLMSF